MIYYAHITLSKFIYIFPDVKYIFSAQEYNYFLIRVTDLYGWRKSLEPGQYYKRVKDL